MSVMNRQNFLEKLFLIFLNDKLARQLKRQVRVASLVSLVAGTARLTRLGGRGSVTSNCQEERPRKAAALSPNS